MLENLNVKQYIKEALKELRFKELTEIQEKVIPLVLRGKDVVGKSQTGSGKTHSFMIPIFEALEEDVKEVQAVITTPTRELALQIYNVANQIAKFAGKDIDIRMYVGGSDREKEMGRLENSQPQIVIGTPGKLKDLVVDEKKLLIYKTKMFVVDEADMTLESGFMDDLDQFAGLLPEKLLMMVFSATIPETLKPFLNKYMHSPEYIEVKPHEIASINVEHIMIHSKNKDKFELLDTLLANINPYLALVFANKKERVEEVHKHLISKGKKVGIIHGDLDPRERKRMIKRVMDHDFEFVVASDIAARGIDIQGVSHVINMELPRDVEFYIHRTGRTGRANLDGIAYSFYDYLDQDYVNKLESKGIKLNFKNIVRGEIVDSRAHNEREKRKGQQSEIDKKARKLVRKPKVVKPGYKKKMEEQVRVEKKKLKLEEFRNDRRDRTVVKKRGN